MLVLLVIVCNTVQCTVCVALYLDKINRKEFLLFNPLLQRFSENNGYSFQCLVHCYNNHASVLMSSVMLLMCAHFMFYQNTPFMMIFHIQSKNARFSYIYNSMFNIFGIWYVCVCVYVHFVFTPVFRNFIVSHFALKSLPTPKPNTNINSY